MYTTIIFDFFGVIYGSKGIDKAVIELIKNLKKNYKISILSNSRVGYVAEVLKESNLDQYFNSIVASSDVGHVKPSLEIFHIALTRLGAKPKETIFIDDSQYNVDGAEILGIKSILFTDTKTLEYELKNLKIKF